MDHSCGPQSELYGRAGAINRGAYSQQVESESGPSTVAREKAKKTAVPASKSAVEAAISEPLALGNRLAR